jgi:PKD repeat protein
MGRRIFAAALAVLGAGALAAPAGAATTRVVDQTAGPYTTITAAILAADPGDTIDIHPGSYDEQLWIPKDDLTLRATPGTVSVHATSPSVVSLMGRRDVLDGVSVSGGPGGVRIEGDGAVVRNATVLSEGTAVTITGAVTALIDHVLVATSGLSGTALVVRNDAVDGQRVTVLASILVGGRLGTAMDVLTGQAGDLSPRGAAALTLIHSTVAGAPTALTTARAGQGGEVTAKAYNSIVHGAAPALIADATNDLTTPDATTFRNNPAFDFHLRADAPAVHLGGDLPLGLPAPATDFDGRGFSPLGGSSGALQYVNTKPTAVLTASTDTVGQFTPVTFDASGSSDPDVGGSIATYAWRFSDAQETVTSSGPKIQHAFADVGTATASLRVTDNNGAEAFSGSVTITVTDAIAPALRITSPRDGARLHARKTVRRSGKKRRVVNVLRFGGRATDAGGVARVELTLRRLPAAGKNTKNPGPAACTFLDAARRIVGARPCAAPPVIAAVRRGDAWSWSTPSRMAVPAGRWELTARATDRAGNLATSVLHFSVT